jgi:hypothetical protein
MLEQEEKLISQLKAEVESLKMKNRESGQELIKLNGKVLEKDDVIGELEGKL